MKSITIALFAVICALTVSAGAAVADDVQPLRIGTTHDIAGAPLFITAANGYFKDEGLEAELTFFDSQEQLQEAAASGAIDIGTEELDASFYTFSARHHLKITPTQLSSKTFVPASVLRSSTKAFDAGLRGDKDFPARRVGFHGEGSGLRYSLTRNAEKFGVDAGAITFSWFDTPAQEVAALSQDEADAVALPYVTALQRGSESKGALIMRLSNFGEWQKGVIFARAEAIAANHKRIEKFVRAYQRGVAEYDLTFQQRDDDGEILAGAKFPVELALIVRQTELPEVIVQNALPYCDRLARLDVTDIENQIKLWQDKGLLDKRIDAAGLLDLSFISDHIRHDARAYGMQ